MGEGHQGVRWGTSGGERAVELLGKLVYMAGGRGLGEGENGGGAWRGSRGREGGRTARRTAA